MLPTVNTDVAFSPEAHLYGDLASPEQHRPVVLVVDDERIIADTVSLILKRNGFTVFTAYDALSALDIAATISPELLLSDVTMLPEMNGVDLALEMVRLAPDCKILLFSGQTGTMDILARARRAGHTFKLLAKPLHPTELVAHVTEFFSGRETARQ